MQRKFIFYFLILMILSGCNNSGSLKNQEREAKQTESSEVKKAEEKPLYDMSQYTTDEIISEITRLFNKGVKLPYVTSAFEGNEYGNFGAEQAFDNKIETAWVDGVEGDGIGESILFAIPPDTVNISIFPGYGTDKAFNINNRIKSGLFLVFYDELDSISLAYQWEYEFNDEFQFQRIPYYFTGDRHFFGAFIITDVHKGTDPDTSLAEIQFNSINTMEGDIPPMFYDIYGKLPMSFPANFDFYSDQHIFKYLKHNIYGTEEDELFLIYYWPDIQYPDYLVDRNLGGFSGFYFYLIYSFHDQNWLLEKVYQRNVPGATTSSRISLSNISNQKVYHIANGVKEAMVDIPKDVASLKNKVFIITHSDYDRSFSETLYYNGNILTKTGGIGELWYKDDEKALFSFHYPYVYEARMQGEYFPERRENYKYRSLIPPGEITQGLPDFIADWLLIEKKTAFQTSHSFCDFDNLFWFMLKYQPETLTKAWYIENLSEINDLSDNQTKYLEFCSQAVTLSSKEFENLIENSEFYKANNICVK